MRQGKLSDLIHNSSAFPNLNSCSVEVHFTEIIDLPGPDEFEPVPNSDIVVSRAVERSNTDKKSEKSSYYINGRTSSYTEVTHMLRDKGVDLDHKRFLILQGEVESIALMKPKARNEHEDGLLEYLEDIIGTAHYKEPIEEAAKQLEKCNEEREDKLNRLKIIQSEKGQLEERKNDALDYISTENEIAVHKNQLFQYERFVHEKDMENQTVIIDDTKVKLEEEQARFHEASQLIQDLESTVKAAQSEVKKLEENAKSATAKLQKIDRAEIELKEKEKHLVQKRKKLEKSIDAVCYILLKVAHYMG